MRVTPPFLTPLNQAPPFLLYTLIVVLLLLYLVVYWGGLSNIIDRWITEEEYGHSFLLPIVSGYLIWDRRSELEVWAGDASWWGVVWCFGCLLVALVGEITALYLLVHYSMVGLLLGVSLAWLGPRATLLTAGPILLLLFAIPIPYFLEAQFTVDLQLVSSQLGVYVLRLLSIPVFLDGNVIDLGVYQLQVVEACAGLNYLYPLLGLGFICAYLFRAAFWQRALIVLSTIPITILMNSVRIAIVGVLVRDYGPSAAEGFLHEFQGWVIFLICMALLAAEIAILSRFGPKFEKNRDSEDVSSNAARVSSLNWSRLGVGSPILSVVGLLAVTAIVLHSIDARQERVPERSAFLNFPTILGPWIGQPNVLEQRVIAKLGFSDYLSANYSKVTDQTPVQVYAAYYESQRKGISPHSPRVCLPGGGWEVASIERTVLKFDQSSNYLPSNRVVMRKGGERLLVYYWFDQRGREFANEYLMKWYLLKDALMLNRTDGSLVRVTTPIMRSSTNAIEDAESRIRSLVQELRPRLSRYIPN